MNEAALQRATMKIEARASHGVVILDIEGRMTVEADRPVSIADLVRDLLRQGRRHFLVNLKGVSSLDTTGVRDIVEAYVTSTRQDGSLKLLNLPARVRDVLTVTRLLTVLESFDGEDEAVASFGAMASN
jgi:anti-sigma B factor antagonist